MHEEAEAGTCTYKLAVYRNSETSTVLAETGLTSEAAYSEGDVAALLYRDVPEKQFQRTLKCSIRKHLLICKP